ncbi:MAG: lamin tail domain-containing protein, partial [Flavobacteriales bacterium]
DAGLITALGLDTLFVGYTQLDETAQQAGTDLSISRIPDGGAAYDYTSYVLQVITTGTWNLPPCAAGSISFADGTASFAACDNTPSILAAIHPDTAGYGDSLVYVLVNEAGLIAQLTSDTLFELSGYATGNYSIYSVFFNGTSEGLALDSAFANAGATNCFSASQPIAMTIQSCGGCIGGTINSDLGVSATYCQGTAAQLTASNVSSTTTDSYIYLVADSTNHIVSYFESTLTLGSLVPGSYSITGLSYMGDLDTTTLELGDTLSAVTASTCQDYSTNTISITILDCIETTPCSSLFFSEYFEGTQGTKALEIFNPTLTTVDLTGYSVVLYSNGAVAASQTLNLTGTLAPLSTYVISNPGTGGGGGAANPTVLALADITSVVANFSGNDAVELRNNGVVVDVIGIVGNDPGANVGWPVGTASTLNNDLVRKFNIQAPTSIWSISASQWDVFSNTDFSHLGNHSFQPCTDDVLIGFEKRA